MNLLPMNNPRTVNLGENIEYIKESLAKDLAARCPYCRRQLAPILPDGKRWCHHCHFWIKADGSPSKETREWLKKIGDCKMSKIYLTPEQATELLPDGEDIHTFKNNGSMMFGCDWQRSEVLERLNSTDMVIEVSGTNARALKHGLATTRRPRNSSATFCS